MAAAVVSGVLAAQGLAEDIALSNAVTDHAGG
jgi:hypothetical protein